jgi:hypothetical protein
MHWFRSHRHHLTALALFALALQFALCLSDPHVDRFAFNPSTWGSTATVGRAIVAAIDKATSANLPASPRQKAPNSLADDFCAICAHAGLVGTLILPVVPTFPVGISSSKPLRWSFVAGRALTIDYFAFEARGPPVA